MAHANPDARLTHPRAARRYPMTLSVLGLVTTAAVCSFVLRIYPHMQRALIRVPKSPPPGASSPPEPSFHTPATISNHFWLTNMVPIGAAQGITFACGNAAYMYLTITFTQVSEPQQS